MYKRFIKRVFDFLLSLFLILILTPVWIIVIPVFYFSNEHSGIFFYQNRPGLNGKIFRIIKFKTMTDEMDQQGNLMPEKMRLTRIGKFMRSFSIDELPQLFNVLKGDMSLIGPRPLLVQYLELYDQRQKNRHNVRPGLTGWAQCKGRNSITWKEKFEYDIWYVNNLSFILDMKIILLTIKNVIIRAGINSPTATTMETFTGNN